MAKRPDVLLCDEPTGALDYATGKIVLDVLRGVNEKTGTSVITITHNAAIGGMANRVVRLMDGRVRDAAVLEAVGLNAEGIRLALGVSVSLSEQEINC